MRIGSCCAHIHTCFFSVSLRGTDVGEENGHILGEKKPRIGKIASIRCKKTHVYRVIIL